MANTIKVRIMQRVGDPSRGVILQPGAIVDLPEFWANRYVGNGSAEKVETKSPEPKTKAKPKK